MKIKKSNKPEQAILILLFINYNIKKKGVQMVIKEYIAIKEACEIIGVSRSTMYKHFKKIKELYTNSITNISGIVNRRDFEHYFNIGSSYRRGLKN